MAAETKDTRRASLLVLCLLSVVVGLVTGLGAVAFRDLVALVHNLFFMGKLSMVYDANEFTEPSVWGMGIILAPVIGGLIVVYIVDRFAPEAKGHGVPEVLDAIYHREGVIRPVVALIKILASGLSIGSGASVGREGPIIQIGSSLGSTLGQVFHLTTSQKITLLAAGAGAGIAATFNTPLGAVMFAVELMLPEISARTFLPVVLATGTATYIGRIFLGMQPAFFVPLANVQQLAPLEPGKIAAFVVLGVICGLAAFAFVRLLPWAEDQFARIKNIYVRNVIAMTIVGTLFYMLLVNYGHYYVEGVSYGTIQAVLKGELTEFHLLAFLFLAKLVATCVSLAGGASGGVFAPSLFLGTTIGGAFGAGLSLIWPDFAVSIPEFAMVGMASVVGGATGAAVMAITMIFEMTLDYNIIVPLIVAVAISIGLRRALFRENIYSIKLLRRGRKIPTEQHTNMYLVRHAKEIMDTELTVFDAATPVIKALGAVREQPGRAHSLVRKGRRIGGVVTHGALLHVAAEPDGEQTVGEVAMRNFILVREDDILHDVFRRLNTHHRSSVALVVRAGDHVPRIDDVVGVISRAQIADAVLAAFRA